MICYPAESEDQQRLLNSLLSEPVHLTLAQVKICAYAAALACQDRTLMDLVADTTGKLELEQRRLLTYAVSRMAIANPYFSSQAALNLSTETSHQALELRSSGELGIHDMTAYHFSCACISMVNRATPCLAEHVERLQQAKQSDAAIDEALKITAAIIATRQIVFLENRWPVYSS